MNKNRSTLAISILVLLITLTSCNPTEEISERGIFKSTAVGEIIWDELNTNYFVEITTDIEPITTVKIKKRGVCWDQYKSTPNIKSSKTTDSISGSITDTLTFSEGGKSIYIRPYVITIDDEVIYGDLTIVTTPFDINYPNDILNADLVYDSISDIDGNVYRTIAIAGKTWMAENLRVTHYRNGDAILSVDDNTTWYKLTTGGQCTYNTIKEKNTVNKLGRLYNYYAVSDTRNIAPEGWHVANDAEWAALEDSLSADTILSVPQQLGSQADWIKVYEGVGTTGYIDQNIYPFIINTTGFSALPSGGRYGYGVCNYISSNCAWWTSSSYDNLSAWYRGLAYNSNTVGRNFYPKNYGLSIRCVKD